MKKTICVETLISRYESNVKIVDIAKELNVSDRTILSRLNELIQQGVISRREKLKGCCRKELDYDYIDHSRRLGIKTDIIAKKLKSNRKTILSAIRYMETIGYDTSNYFYTDIDVIKLIDLYRKKLSYEFMADILNNSGATIRRAVEKLIKGEILVRREMPRSIDWDKDEFIKSYNEAESVAELSEKHFVSSSVINVLAKRYNLPLKKPRAPQSRLPKERFIRLYNANLEYQGMADVLGVNKSTVARYARKLQKEGVLPVRQKIVEWPSDEKLRQQYLDAKRSHWKLANIYEVSKTVITKKLNQLYKKGKLPEYKTYLDNSDNSFIKRQSIFFGL